MFARSLLLSLRADGPRRTLARLRHHLYGDQRFELFVRRLTPPTAPVTLPIETHGVQLRRAAPADLRDLQVRRHEPPEARDALTRGAALDTFVAVRGHRVVGVAWYVDAVRPAQPWYGAVAPHMVTPARFTANIYVEAGEKGAGWALAKTASEVLAASGVRSIVGMVGSENKPSILLTRLLGGRTVARLHVRHRCGRRTTTVESIEPAQ